ncbi:CTP synthase [Lachnospiraceae bacterium]|nr:CTP synthase [Lachnospiraceae bacterium]
MDEMNIISKFTTALVSKAAKVIIKKKLGVDMDIWLKEMKVTINDGNTHAHLDIDVELNKEELKKLLKGSGLD